MNRFRWSLQRRIALGLAGMFVAGGSMYIIISYFIRFWSGGAWCSPFQTYLCNFSVPSPPSRLVAAGGLLSVTAVILWTCWMLAGKLIKPLHSATEVIHRVGPQNLGQRIRLAGAHDELKRLADALDDALDRLASGYESQRRFASNASHELRTPLAVQRLLTEVAMDDPAASDDLMRLGPMLLRTHERNERLIEGLLILAESDRGLQGKVTVELDEIVATVIDAHKDLAAKRGVRLHSRLVPRTVAGDPILLEQLVRNLVINAINYNHPDGRVDVAVAAEPALTVRNTGATVPAEAVPVLFEPFRRLAADRTEHGGGAGLGLSIVRSITSAHAGTVSARPGSLGGLVVEVSLPR